MATDGKPADHECSSLEKATAVHAPSLGRITRWRNVEDVSSFNRASALASVSERGGIFTESRSLNTWSHMKVYVTKHAIDEYRRRRANQRGFRAVEADIQEMVEDVIATGRVLNHRPKGFSLYGRKKSASSLAPGQWFAPCGDIGFILKKENNEWVVVTMLTRTGT